jgi:uncharacterized small protein (DUF1192 family)
VQLQLIIQQIQAQLAADHVALADIKQAQKQYSKQQLLQEQSTAPASMHGQQLGPVTVTGAASFDAGVAAQLQELPLLQLRLTAVEQSLAAAVAAPQPGVAAAGQNRTIDNRASNGSRSHMIEAGSGASVALVASLPAQVAALQAQVSQLLQARAAASRSNSTARSGSTPGSSSNVQQQLAQQTLQVAAAAEDGSDAAADDTAVDEAAPADIDDAAAGTADDAGTAIAAAVAELSERVVELQAQLDGLSAAKADREELERLRGLLAETAAQVRLDARQHYAFSWRQCLQCWQYKFSTHCTFGHSKCCSKTSVTLSCVTGCLCVHATV